MTKKKDDRPFGQVIKTLTPPQAGTVKLLRRYGNALVCVRYREDPARARRLTTVELVVEEWPQLRRADPTVRVRLAYGEDSLRRRALAFGAQWDPADRVWTMPRSVARLLKLTRRLATK